MERIGIPVKKDNITFEAVDFTNYLETPEDECGSAANHAMELNTIVKDLKNKTEEERINVVARSKGGTGC